MVVAVPSPTPVIVGGGAVSSSAASPNLPLRCEKSAALTEVPTELEEDQAAEPDHRKVCEETAKLLLTTNDK